MSRYAREARRAAVKCIGCNAPVVQTVDGTYVCVECGTSPMQPAVGTSVTVSVPDDDSSIDLEAVTSFAKGDAIGDD